MRHKRTRRKIPLRELWQIQRELTGDTGKLMSMVELANVVAQEYEWPTIAKGQPHYREFAKQYLQRYIADRERLTVDNPRCWIYFIQQGDRGPIKIGVSDNPDARLQSLQTANPRKLNVLATIACKSKRHAHQLEADIHKRFDDYRLQGEWFARSIVFGIGKLSERVKWMSGDITTQSLLNKVKRAQA